MKILVINCGSSSLKFQLINSDDDTVMAKGLCERIGSEGSQMEYAAHGGEKEIIKVDMPDHAAAAENVINTLIDKDKGVIGDLSHIDAVGHRIVHGGEKFASSVIIDDEVIKAIEECNDLAPLHNPANIVGIKACMKVMPNIPQCGVFDTAFHQTMPKKAYLYGIPYEYYEKYKVRKYGFHGTSHSYVSKRAAEILGIPYENSKIVVCHLGNGASICGVLNGKSIDTSMGLTPLDGLIMGTRSGSFDPAVIEFLMNKENKSISEIMTELNKKSGVLSLAGIGSSDFRDITKEMLAGNERAEMTIDTFCYKVAQYIGAYMTAMHGLDAIVFTAGLGENNFRVRKKISSYFDYLGVEIDDEANSHDRTEIVISKESSKIKVLQVPTNEELKIAQETMELLK